MSIQNNTKISAAAPLTGAELNNVSADARAYFKLIGTSEPTNLGMLCEGEECGGTIMGYLMSHPDSDRLCLADVFVSSYYPVGGGDVINAFYNFRELSARQDVSFTGDKNGYYLAVAIGMHRSDDDGCAVNQWHRNNDIMSDAGLVPKYERGNVPFKPLMVLPGASLFYEADNLDPKMCGGVPTLKFDFSVGEVVKIKEIASKPEYNDRLARVQSLPSDPNDSEARYNVVFIRVEDGAVGFRARPRNMEINLETEAVMK